MITKNSYAFGTTVILCCYSFAQTRVREHVQLRARLGMNN
jgi:hypothetical protein